MFRTHSEADSGIQATVEFLVSSALVGRAEGWSGEMV